MPKYFNYKQIICVVLLVTLTGCNNQKEGQSTKGDNEQTKYTRISTSTINDDITSDVKKKILAMEEIIEVQVVHFKDSIYIAAKPQHHERFQLDQLKKKVETKIHRIYPNMEIYVSVDKKIVMLLEELESNIGNKEISENEVKNKLKNIRTKMNSDT